MTQDLTVVDLFCGGGGFSEGFRQAGFDVSYAADLDAGACETYRTNCRPDEDATVEQADVLELEPEDLPGDVDILIGSPPCTEFSYAKEGGGGDIDEGMKLVYRFLYFVVELEPDYWIMENVPRLDDYLPDEVEHSLIPGLPDDADGVLEIPRRVKIDAEKYGTPQRRTRLFSGDFPLSEESESTGLNLGEVQNLLPDPKSDPDSVGVVSDPVYGSLELPAEKLTDHFYNSFLTDREAKEIRVRKEDHSFYGPMSFPDESGKPSRTVLAMNRRIARETLVLEEPEAPSGYSKFRKPTIREIATIQGFPISYQFQGSSLSQKWRRVGDAVPPTVSYRLGLSILDDLDELGDEIEPVLNSEVPEPDTNLNGQDLSSKGRRRLSLSRSFRHHVPYDDMREFRVDLETVDERYEHPWSADSVPDTSPPVSDMLEMNLVHPVGFQVVLYRGYAKEVESTPVSLDQSLEYLARLVEKRPELEAKVSEFLSSLNEELGPKVPDATTLQAIRSRRHEWDEPREFDILETIASHRESDHTGLVDELFPRDLFEPHDGFDSVMEGDESTDLSDFADGDSEESRSEGNLLPVPEILDGTNLPVRVLMKLVAANYAAHKLNHCAEWILNNPDDAFRPSEIEEYLEVGGTPPTCTSEECVEQRIQRHASNPETIEQSQGHAD